MLPPWQAHTGNSAGLTNCRFTAQVDLVHFVVLWQNVWHWEFLKNRNLFAYSSAGWKPKVKVPKVWCPVRAAGILIVSSPGGRQESRKGQAAPCSLFCWNINPIHVDRDSLPYAPPLNTIAWGLKFQCTNFGRRYTFKPLYKSRVWDSSSQILTDRSPRQKGGALRWTTGDLEWYPHILTIPSRIKG